MVAFVNSFTQLHSTLCASSRQLDGIFGSERDEFTSDSSKCVFFSAVDRAASAGNNAATVATDCSIDMVLIRRSPTITSFKMVVESAKSDS